MSKWYIYGPHWSLPASMSREKAYIDSSENKKHGPRTEELHALQTTFLKRTTAFSYELSEDDKRYVPENAVLNVQHLMPVSDPSERARHSGSAEHLEVLLTPKSEQNVEEDFQVMKTLHESGRLQPTEEWHQRALWYIYSPHWQLPRGRWHQRFLLKQDQLRALQATCLKRSTALSRELAAEAQRGVPEGQLLNVQHLMPVSDPQERSLHSGSAEHLEVILTPRSAKLIEDLQVTTSQDGPWYIYAPHWIRRNASIITAKEDTWIKRSCQRSDLLPGHLKIAVAGGEMLVHEAGDLSTRLTMNTVEHWKVHLPSDVLARMRKIEPRFPLCKYFSPYREGLLDDILTCFSNAGLGSIAENKIHEASILGDNEPRPIRRGKIALLLPHGAYCNSGFVAAHGFAKLSNRQVARAIIVGNFHAAWNKVALCDQVWHTPIGRSAPDLEGLAYLQEQGYKVDRQVHSEEHSVENQIPFLQYHHPGARILPIGVGVLSLSEAERLASHIAQLVGGREGTVLLGTTDFSHEGHAYGGPSLPMEEVTELTRRKDAPLLKAVLEMDAERLLQLSAGSSMCGAGAAAVFLLSCQKLGYRHPAMLRYMVNTEVTPCDSTTGFASFAFSNECSH